MLSSTVEKPPVQNWDELPPDAPTHMYAVIAWRAIEETMPGWADGFTDAQFNKIVKVVDRAITFAVAATGAPITMEDMLQQALASAQATEQS